LLGIDSASLLKAWQDLIDFLAYLAPTGVLTSGLIVSLVFGSLLLFFWLRENFAVLSTPLADEVRDLIGQTQAFDARDFAHATRYRRARRLYIVFFLLMYWCVSLLGVTLANRVGLIPANFVALLPSSDAFPLALALSIQAASPTIPHVISIDSRFRAWLHEMIAIPTELRHLLS
jgi:hypothetical protein